MGSPKKSLPWEVCNYETFGKKWVENSKASFPLPLGQIEIVKGCHRRLMYWFMLTIDQFEDITLQKVDDPIVQWYTHTHTTWEGSHKCWTLNSRMEWNNTMWPANLVWLLTHSHIWTTLTSTMFQGGRYDQKGSP